MVDIYYRLETLHGLKVSGHITTLTEALNLTDGLYKGCEIQNEQQYRIAPDKFDTLLLEIPSKSLEQIAYNTRSRIEEHMLVTMDKSTHEEHLY